MLLMLLTPIITALACYILKGRSLTGYVSLVGAIFLSVFSAFPIVKAFNKPLEFWGFFYMDAFSAYIASLVVFLGLVSSIYSIHYIDHEFHVGLINEEGIRIYYSLLHLFIFTMLLVVVSNNLALMWIAIEATTIVSAILIGLGYKKRPMAIEAAWKYIILCTVGLAFALLGIFITYYASTATGVSKGMLNWTDLIQIAHMLNPLTMKLAFIFVLVGYGTKAGLAPLHNWLPDAHSEAPSPISALLSGILLNTAFYGIIRFIAIVEPSTGKAFVRNLLIIFGILSVGISALFILVQENYKRLLAYSSIEHMGIIALGIGIGGPIGIYGALLHILNHVLAKPLMFLTAGRIQAYYGSTKIEKVRGVLSTLPLLGTLTFIGVLSLSGSPPFNVFISEFTILKAAALNGLWWVVASFLFFLVIVFYGMLSAFGRMLFGQGSAERSRSLEKVSVASDFVMVLMALLIILLGFKVPDFLDSAIRSCIYTMGVK